MKKTKKFIVFFSVAGLVLGLLWSKVEILFCGVTHNHCENIFMSVLPLFSIFFPLSVLSVFVYFLRDEIYVFWRNFSLIWIPLSLVWYLSGSHINESGGMGLGFGVSESGMNLIISLFLYSVISLILIIYKSISLKFGKK